MNAYLRFDGNELWDIAGWTMLHFLWMGAIIAMATALCRLIARRAAPNIRYAIALASLFLMAALPLVIAMWLLTSSPPFPGGARGGFVTPAEPAAPVSVLDQPTIELGGEPAATDATNISGPQPSAFSPPPSSASGPSPSAVVPPPSVATGSASAVFQTFIPYLPWLWLIGTPLTFTLLATGMIGTRRLRRASRVLEHDPISDLCSKLAASLRVTRRVTVAVCERVAAPVLIGIVRPMILLPPAALTGWSPDEIEMVLLHELAHVRRWDNLVNLLQRCIESLFFFHPAIWLVSNWVRGEREACCDAIVVRRTNRPHAYAEMIVALAAQMPRSLLFQPAASSAMAAGPLRSRIRRILQLEDDPMLVSGKSFAIMLSGLVVAATLAVLYLPAIGQAEESAAEATETSVDNDNAADNANESSESTELTTDRLQLNSSRGQTAIDAIGDAPNISGVAPAGNVDPFANAPTPHKFPSLEDQKLADVAWKRLGLELEPLGADDQKRIRALGYEGGLKVVGGHGDMMSQDIQIVWGDILVGLHVWPTIQMKDVAAILNRDDLAELNPLRFYVVRRVAGGAYGGGYEGGRGGYGRGFGGEAGQSRDDLVIGRIAVRINGNSPTITTYPTSSAQRSAFEPRPHPVRPSTSPAMKPSDQPVIKTFPSGPPPQNVIEDTADVLIDATTGAPVQEQDPSQPASASRPSESIGVLKKIVEREKQKFERMNQLALKNVVSESEVATQKADYEISLERLRQATRALEYHKLLVDLAKAEYQQAVESNQQAPGVVSESELRRLKLRVQLAEAKFRELAE